MLWPVIKALLGHYRRYPLQIILVWIGLTLGVSLLVGVTSINHHARESYQSGEKLFSNPLPYRIRAKHSAQKVPQGFYIQLRRAGFHQCSPFDIMHLTSVDSMPLMLVGVDPIALIGQDPKVSTVAMMSLSHPPYPLLVSQDLAGHMNWSNGDLIELDDGSFLGPIMIDNSNLISGTRMIADISLLRMLKRSAGIAAIACSDMPEAKLESLNNILPNGVHLTRNTRSELNSLTKAFHMNLMAMGMLSFLVGLFIFYQAMSLSLTQRQRLVGILRQIGVSGMQLGQALIIELFFLVTFAWLCGNALGMLLASQLLPAVSSSLSNLYDANVGLAISWSWQASFYSFVMAFMGALLSCIWPLIRLLQSQPVRLSSRLSLVRFSGKEFTWQALIAVVLCVVGVVVYQAPDTQEIGFAVIALLLLSVALLMPFMMWRLFQNLSFSLKWVRIRWLFADAAASMSYRGVATMAFMLALAANIGVETMVGSFRDTTDKWLTQRLSADIYIYPSQNSASGMNEWLEQQPEVREVWWRWQHEMNTSSGTLHAVSTGDSEGEADSMTVKLGIPDYWHHLHHSKSLMVSESMALKLGLKPGDYIDLEQPLGNGWQVVGVYYDYGNPYNQILLSHRNWLYAFSGSGSINLGVLLKEGVNSEGLKRRFEDLFQLPSERIYDNNNIYAQAMRVFDNTFAIADTLGNITLIIAVFGLFFATLAGEFSRQRHFSLLRCMGVSGKELVIFGGLQLFVFGAISVIIALPLGLTLAHLIVDIIIKQSFGWSFELQMIPWMYAQTIAWAMLAIMIAGALPVIRMVRNAPMKSLRDAL